MKTLEQYLLELANEEIARYIELTDAGHSMLCKHTKKISTLVPSMSNMLEINYIQSARYVPKCKACGMRMSIEDNSFDSSHEFLTREETVLYKLSNG